MQAGAKAILDKALCTPEKQLFRNLQEVSMIPIEEVWPEEIIASYEEYAQRVTCPICGNETFNNWVICPHCQWEYDYSEGYSDVNHSRKWVYRLKYKLKRLLKRK